MERSDTATAIFHNTRHADTDQARPLSAKRQPDTSVSALKFDRWSDGRMPTARRSTVVESWTIRQLDAILSALPPVATQFPFLTTLG